MWRKGERCWSRGVGQGRLHRDEHWRASLRISPSEILGQRLNINWLPDSKNSWARRVGRQEGSGDRSEWVGFGGPDKCWTVGIFKIRQRVFKTKGERLVKTTKEKPPHFPTLVESAASVGDNDHSPYPVADPGTLWTIQILHPAGAGCTKDAHPFPINQVPNPRN